MPLHLYEIVGRKRATEDFDEKKGLAADNDPAPQIFRMRLFAQNVVNAKSRFWYFLHQTSKLKRSTGEILSVHEIRERKTTTVKNYGITIRYNSRSGTHNMYKEFRSTNLCDAVQKMYNELAGSHRVRFSSIQIVDTCVVPAGQRAAKKFSIEGGEGPAPAAVRRPHVKQFLTGKIKFPLAHRVPKPSSKKFKTIFKASRPSTYFS